MNNLEQYVRQLKDIRLLAVMVDGESNHDDMLVSEIKASLSHVIAQIQLDQVKMHIAKYGEDNFKDMANDESN